MTTPEAAAPAAAGAHAGAEHKTEGLPQFDTTQWAGQAAWFLIIFGVVLALMRFVFVPRIGGAIEAREAKITADFEAARQLKAESEAQSEAAKAEAGRARGEAQRLGAEARAKAQAEIATKIAAEEARLSETMTAAEARIAQARDAAMANVRGVAVDAAQAIVGKLTGKPASAQELDAVAGGRA